MTKIILIVGGSGSGKSEFAEEYARNIHNGNGKLLYVATMNSTDEECDKKIDIHKKRREGTEFVTVEKKVRIGEIDACKGDTILIECVSNLLANEMYLEGGRGENACTEIINDIVSLGEKCNLVIVSNEVSMDGDYYDEYTISYINSIAEINKRVAKISDKVYEIVAGISIEWR